MRGLRTLAVAAGCALAVALGGTAAASAAQPSCHITSQLPSVYDTTHVGPNSYGWCAAGTSPGIRTMDLYSIVQWLNAGTWYNAPFSLSSRGGAGVVNAKVASSSWICRGGGTGFREADYLVVTMNDNSTYTWGWQYGPTLYPNARAGPPQDCSPPIHL